MPFFPRVNPPLGTMARMGVITIEKTIAAIVERSLPLRVPREGMLTLLPRQDGRYRLAQDNLDQGPPRVRVRAKSLDGRRLPAGHALTYEEANNLVRVLLGLDVRAGSPELASLIGERGEKENHLGVEFALDELARLLWRWTIYPMKETGTASWSGEFIGTRQQARAACIRAIDEWLAGYNAH
jgi:hypothetical protein